jgi:hypothetical protein
MIKFPKELENNLAKDAENFTSAMSISEKIDVWPRTILGKYMMHHKGGRRKKVPV